MRLVCDADLIILFSYKGYFECNSKNAKCLEGRMYGVFYSLNLFNAII